MAATAKQLAALKRGRATAAKNRAAKKRVGTSQTKKSMTTKKTPTKRLKKRRAKNTEAGFYPNPKKRSVKKAGYIMSLVDDSGKNVAYWTGGVWDTEQRNAKFYANLAAMKRDIDEPKKIQKLLAVKYRRMGIAAIPAKK